MLRNQTPQSSRLSNHISKRQNEEYEDLADEYDEEEEVQDAPTIAERSEADIQDIYDKEWAKIMKEIEKHPVTEGDLLSEVLDSDFGDDDEFESASNGSSNHSDDEYFDLKPINRLQQANPTRHYN